MEKTPEGTSVGVDDPYEHAGVCDHLTDDGRCRFAFEHPEQDEAFARDRRADDFACPVVDPEREAFCASKKSSEEHSDSRDSDWEWADCPHFRSRNRDRECVRCGLEERRMAHSDERPLLEEHHLSYARGGETLSHEITVYLCRWCHAKVHQSWARVTDDAAPDPEAIAEKEDRRSREQSELGFESAAERYDE
ncbi:hypothetical protein G9464_09095 [Halostella sp. JP-L12]|uniref:DUF7097 family protein n=1 Tax=Halostella TaxID=1843185 RepID=UPI000EF7638B|nr:MULTISPECIES: hypothetical protein [Halostella]NHN47751.1 hypothetical protein [Halostella sp. JP-L12]